MYQIDFKTPVHVHFIGIGGISMSGLAEVLIENGFKVSGSDGKKSALTEHLESLGASVYYPQSADNVNEDIDVVVYTAAILPTNPERIRCEKLGLPMLTRAQLLGQLMDNYDRSIAIAGTHGKTTTTSMISQVLLAADEDPTISVGGILKAIGSNIRVGKSDLFVTEACEYTNSYHEFYPKYSIILNIEEDHMDFFKDLAEIRASFRKFASNIKHDGFLIINGDIPKVDEIYDGLDCNVITYGSDETSDYHAENISFNEMGCATFTPVFRGQVLDEVSLNVPGQHNVSNALGVIALSMEMDIPYAQIQAGLLAFGGADRRFQYKGKYKGATIIDDYAHHPTEIAASLSAAKNYPHNRIVCAFQPHTYTRTKAFLNEFAEALAMADVVLLADVYAAREKDEYGVNSSNLAEKLKDQPCESHYLKTFDVIEEFFEKNCMNGDLLITMGAGDIYLVGEHLLAK